MFGRIAIDNNYCFTFLLGDNCNLEGKAIGEIILWDGVMAIVVQEMLQKNDYRRKISNERLISN